MTPKNDIPWEGRVVQEADEFAHRCAELRESNPYQRPALEDVMPALMTSLWDRGFSQSEIKNAFERAVAELPRYAAGEERRGDPT